RPAQVVRRQRADLPRRVEKQAEETKKPEGCHQNGRDLPAARHGHAPPARYSSCPEQQLLPENPSTRRRKAATGRWRRPCVPCVRRGRDERKTCRAGTGCT